MWLAGPRILQRKDAEVTPVLRGARLDAFALESVAPRGVAGLRCVYTAWVNTPPPHIAWAWAQA